MATTLITGIDGFTGRYLADLLREQGHDVHGTVHREARVIGHEAEKLHVCDITDAESIQHVLRQVRPDYIVHLAAISFVAHGNVEEIYTANIMGTRCLLESCEAAGLQPKKLLLASSANIYGNTEVNPIEETTPIRPANDYGVTKAAMENVAMLYADRLPITLVRPFNYTGAGQSLSFLIPKIVDHVRRKANHIELGNLDVARDISDVRAVVGVYSRILSADSLVSRTFNVCSGNAVTLQGVLKMAMEISGHHLEVVVNPAFVRANEVKVLRGSAARLEAEIGPLGMPPLEETLRWMIEA
jgi:nucleoside-diphosphate-sugar epimerase